MYTCMLLHILRSPATEPCPFVALLSPSFDPPLQFACCVHFAAAVLLLLLLLSKEQRQRSNCNNFRQLLWNEQLASPRLASPRPRPRPGHGHATLCCLCCCLFIVQSLYKFLISLHKMLCMSHSQSDLLLPPLRFAFSFAVVVVAVVVVVVAQHKCHWLSHIAWAYKSHCWGVSRRRSWSWRCLLPLTLYQFSLSPSLSPRLSLPPSHGYWPMRDRRVP